MASFTISKCPNKTILWTLKSEQWRVKNRNGDFSNKLSCYGISPIPSLNLLVWLLMYFFYADAVIPITCVILAFLFALQHYGTHRVGFLFAPIVLAWLFCMSALGLYNIIHWNPHIYKALNPSHMFKFLKKTRKYGWMSLGGILLCMTGKLWNASKYRVRILIICFILFEWILSFVSIIK